MTAPDWASTVTTPGIHNPPAPTAQWNQLSEEELQQLRSHLLQSILQVIVGALTGFITPGDAFLQLGRWAQAIEASLADVPVLGDLIEVFTGLEDGDLTDLGTWVNTVLHEFSPLNAANLFGNLLHLLTGVPIGSLTTDQPNVLIEPLFTTGSIAANPRWSVDPLVSRSDDGSGAAKVLANGVPTALRSGRTPTDKIATGEGQTWTPTIWVRHQTYSGSGPALKLQIVPYKGSERQDFVDIDTYTATGTELHWYELTGDYTVPAGVDGIQVRILLTDTALDGAFWVDDSSLKQTRLIQQSWIAGLADEFTGVLARIQAFIDAVVHALTGSTDLLHSFEDVIAALLAIPFGNVTGVGGPINIGASVLDFIDHLIGGLVGAAGTGAGLADVFHISKLVSSWASLGSMAWDILGLRNNTPVYTGFLPNGKSNYPYTDINTTLDATQAASLIATYRIGESSPLGVVSWLGYGTAGLSAFYVNIWKIDNTTGVWNLAHHSPDIVGDLAVGGTAQWNFYELADPLAVVAGEQYGFELVPVGATHHVRGISTTDTIPDHPYAVIVGAAATRDNTSSPDTPSTPIAKASVTRSGNIPWIEVAIDTGTAEGYHDPVIVYFTESGTIPRPNWAGFVEILGVGSGGGGKSGGTAGFYGAGGSPGKWSVAVWELGVDFDDADTTVTITISPGGAGGILFSNGGAGGDTTIELGDATLTCDGGAGGASFGISGIGANFVGAGPGNYTFNGELYLGGVNQNVYSSGGQSPGGAGSGGNWITVSPGGAGAKGAAWIRFRQAAIEGGGDTPDTTPPTQPTVELVDATYSTITVTATGSTDV